MADAEGLLFEAGSFDAVVSTSAVMFAPDLAPYVVRMVALHRTQNRVRDWHTRCSN
jgi:hypothetical protein